MYKSLTKTKKYPHEILKRVASANAIIKHYKSFSLITVKRHAMVLSFLKANLVILHCSVDIDNLVKLAFIDIYCAVNQRCSLTYDTA